MKNVFISYGHIEYAKKAAELLYEKLDSYEHDGEKLFRVFWDDESIQYGEDWQTSIVHALKETDYILFLACDYSVRDESVCLDEITYFLELKKDKKNIIPIRLDDAILPFGIIRNKSVIWTNHPDGIDEIMTRVLSRLDSAPAGVSEPPESLHEKIWDLIGKGDAEDAADNWHKAKEIYAKALEKARKYYKSYPSYESRRDLSASLERMGNIALSNNDINNAKKYLSDSLVIYKQIAEIYPNYESLITFSKSCAQNALAEKADGNFDKAKELFEEALVYAEKCREIFPCRESVGLCEAIKELKTDE